MKNNYSQINNIKKIREKRGLTLQALSKLSGISLQEIHFLETDKLDLTKMQLCNIAKLCDALKTTPYQLFVDKEFAKSLLTFTRMKYGKKYIAKQ